MDPVMSTGRVPLERLKEERPRHRRLADSGRLESLLTEASTRTELRNAFLFGYSALSIGMLLAVAIFWSVFSRWFG